jgi:hypothetical protein
MKKIEIIDIIRKLGFGQLIHQQDTFLFREHLCKIYITFTNDEKVEFSFFNNLFAIVDLKECNPSILFFELDKFLSSERYNKIKLPLLRDYKLNLLVQ